MKETTKMSRAVSQLEHIYNALNTDFFDGLLPVPIITVQSKPGWYISIAGRRASKRSAGEGSTTTENSKRLPKPTA